MIDVGANTGFYTLLALSVCRGMRVAAYEPYAPVRRILAANLALHPHGRDAAVIAAAVSDCGGSRRLYVPAARHGLVETSASLNAAFKSQHASARLVRSCTLDERHLQGPRVAVIKVDAESHDLEVLTGAAAIMLRHRPVIFLEVLLGADAAGLTALLRRCGYLDSVLAADGPTAPDDRVRHDTHAWNHMWIPRETAPG